MRHMEGPYMVAPPPVIALGAGERLTLALYHATYKYPGCLGFRV